MTKIIVVRHGHVEGISPERFRGRAALALTPEGRRQAAATASRIGSTWTPAAVYTSPLGRCLETGAAIGKLFGLSPSPLAGLNDIDYGEWQGLTPDEVKKRWPDELDGWFRTPEWTEIPGGETLQHLLTRTMSVLREVIHRHRDDTVVLVGHDSVNRVILLQALELPLSRYWRLKQDPCAINEVDFTGDGFIVLKVNETGHLAAAA